MNKQINPAHKHSYQAFAIVSSARTGSTYLESLLSSHPDILSFREIFGVRKGYPGYRGLVYLRTLFHKPNVHHALRVLLHKNTHLLRALFIRLPVQKFSASLLYGSYPSKIKAVGFKYHLYHGTWFPELKEYLHRNKKIKIIYLIRENSLHVLVSQKLAQISNQWALKDKIENKASDVRLILNKDDCENLFFQYEEQEEKAKTLFADHDVLILRYEDLIHNQTSILESVQEFLGVEKHRLSSPMKKQRTKSLTEIIENYGSLKHSFSGTKWAAFFDE